MNYYIDQNNCVHCLDNRSFEKLLPVGCTEITAAEAEKMQAERDKLLQPVWDGKEYVEAALVYQGVEVASKSDVDRITRQRIYDLNGEQAITEKLIAGNEKCPIWDAFIAARAIILQEGNVFIATYNLK